MRNAMQLKAVIKNISKRQTYLGTARDAELYVGTSAGTDFCFKVSSEFYIKRWFSDSGNGGIRYSCHYGYGCNDQGLAG